MTDPDHAELFLAHARTDTERDAIEQWLADRQPSGRENLDVVRLPDAGLGAKLTAADDDLLVTPLRVVWLPGERGGGVLPAVTNLLSAPGSRRPGPVAQRRIVRTDPDRCQVVAGQSATLGDLRQRWSGAGTFAAFVLRQADLALGRAERAMIGGQYKVARHVVDEIITSNRFRDGVNALAEKLDRPVTEIAEKAKADLVQMVAAQSPKAIDAWNALGRYFSRAYRVIVDDSKTEELRRLASKHPLVFLPSHRSYLDPLVLRPALLQSGLPLNHVMGGLNIDFWPIGPLIRRSGYVFIRRSFSDDEVYRWALREYMGYLLSKRFNLEWYIEGGRSRTGKLRPPRYGLLTYLVEAFRESSATDVYLVPVSLTYDQQLFEVEVMAREAHGATKEPESLAWLLKFNRAQDRGTRGSVQVHFGEPVSLRAALADEPDTRLAVQKTAFEVSHRINSVTPVTAGSLVTLMLLGIEDRALTTAEVLHQLGPLTGYLEQRGLASAERLGLTDERGVRRALEALVSTKVVDRYDRGVEPVFRVGPDQHLVAAFYRNSAIHYFVDRAIAELVFQTAAEGSLEDPAADWRRRALDLRDLLKFEFFFSDKEAFVTEIEHEAKLIDPDWPATIANPERATTLLADLRPHLGHRVLAPFLEAYQVVADRLAAHEPRRPIDQKAFLKECLDVARQLRMQQRLTSTESISAELFATALKLAANRDLLDPGRDELTARRQEFAAEIATWVRRVRRSRDLTVRELDTDLPPVAGGEAG